MLIRKVEAKTASNEHPGSLAVTSFSERIRHQEIRKENQMPA